MREGLCLAKTGQQPFVDAPGGTRLVAFDHAHSVRAGRGPGVRKRIQSDHRYRLSTVRTYYYKGAGVILSDFWKDVDGVLKQGG